MALPIAAIVCIVLACWVLVVLGLFALYIFLKGRGSCQCECQACGKEGDESCTCCRNLGQAECCACDPSLQRCLNSCCPKKKCSCVDILLCQCCAEEGQDSCLVNLCKCQYDCKYTIDDWRDRLQIKCSQCQCNCSRLAFYSACCLCIITKKLFSKFKTDLTEYQVDQSNYKEVLICCRRIVCCWPTDNYCAPCCYFCKHQLCKKNDNCCKAPDCFDCKDCKVDLDCDLDDCNCCQGRTRFKKGCCSDQFSNICTCVNCLENGKQVHWDVTIDNDTFKVCQGCHIVFQELSVSDAECCDSYERLHIHGRRCTCFGCHIYGILPYPLNGKFKCLGLQRKDQDYYSKCPLHCTANNFFVGTVAIAFQICYFFLYNVISIVLALLAVPLSILIKVFKVLFCKCSDLVDSGFILCLHWKQTQGESSESSDIPQPETVTIDEQYTACEFCCCCALHYCNILDCDLSPKSRKQLQQSIDQTRRVQSEPGFNSGLIPAGLQLRAIHSSPYPGSNPSHYTGRHPSPLSLVVEGNEEEDEANDEALQRSKYTHRGSNLRAQMGSQRYDLPENYSSSVTQQPSGLPSTNPDDISSRLFNRPEPRLTDRNGEYYENYGPYAETSTPLYANIDRGHLRKHFPQSDDSIQRPASAHDYENMQQIITAQPSSKGSSHAATLSSRHSTQDKLRPMEDRNTFREPTSTDELPIRQPLLIRRSHEIASNRSLRHKYSQEYLNKQECHGELRSHFRSNAEELNNVPSISCEFDGSDVNSTEDPENEVIQNQLYLDHLMKDDRTVPFSNQGVRSKRPSTKSIDANQSKLSSQSSGYLKPRVSQQHSEHDYDEPVFYEDLQKYSSEEENLYASPGILSQTRMPSQRAKRESREYQNQKSMESLVKRSESYKRKMSSVKKKHDFESNNDLEKGYKDGTNENGNDGTEFEKGSKSLEKSVTISERLKKIRSRSSVSVDPGAKSSAFEEESSANNSATVRYPVELFQAKSVGGEEMTVVDIEGFEEDQL